MDLIRIMLSVLKEKTTHFTKIKKMMSLQYIKNVFLKKVRDFFKRLFDIRPKDENDYYAVGPILLSKKLAAAIVVVSGVFCIMYIRMILPDMAMPNSSTTYPAGEKGYPAYKYSSPALKFKSEKVRILGKSGYTAYAGDVEKGVVTGNGTLYRRDGSVVYSGAFEGNSYNGQGKLYYENSGICYEGEFKDNFYEGMGKLYREDGTLKYEGSFLGGFMEGEGKLYNGSGTLVFTGSFRKDSIIYQNFVGIKTSKAADMYSGESVLYETDGGYCNYMKDIGALYFVPGVNSTLDGEWSIESVCVLDDKVSLNGSDVTKIPQVAAVLGEPAYEGNTALTAEDELAVNLAIESGQDEVLSGRALLEVSKVFDDVFEITGFEKDYFAYLYIFEYEDMVYTFFCRDKDGAFSFYTIDG